MESDIPLESIEVDDKKLGPNGCLVSFSGGGIRSASFNSGVLRSLLENDETDISHISTVSGGGYLGTGFITHCLQVAEEGKYDTKIIPKVAQRKALYGDDNLSKKSDTMIWRMERNVNYFLRKGAVSGILSIMLAMLTDAAIFFSTGVFLSEIMIAWHGETIMRVVKFREWYHLAHPMAYAGAILLGIFAFVLILSTFLSCFIEGVLRPIFNFKTSISFHSPTACWIDVFEQSPKLYAVWRGILQFVGLVAVAFGFYWLMVTFTCIWGVFHLKTNNGESWTWLLSSAASLLGVLAANLEKNGVIGTINKAAVLLLLSLCGPILILIMFTRLAMWNVASQLCWYPDDCDISKLPQYCFYTEGTCKAELFALFNYDDLDFVNIEYAAGAILIFWVLMYNRTSISLHEYYRIKLATAFYHPKKRDVKLSELPDRPKLLVNTTLNSYRFENAEEVSRYSHVFLLSKDKCGSTPTGYVPGSSSKTQDYTQNYYGNMMLSTAMAVSGAAVANELGSATDEYPGFFRRLLTFSIAFFNFGWGIWVPLPNGGIIVKSLKDSNCIKKILTSRGVAFLRVLCFIVILGPGIVLGFLTNKVWLDANSLPVQILAIIWAAILIFIVPLHIIPGVAAFLSFSPYFRHLQQIFGIHSNDQDYCYLSDGGHLENLGAYELMKEQQRKLREEREKVGKEEYEKDKELRERHPIYSFDAGKDDNTLEALYGVLRLAHEDGIIVSWDFVHDSVKKLVPKKYGEDMGKTEERIIRVTLKYPEGTTGVFYYVKSVLKTDDPDNILLLSYQDSEFPNHSTANQFFNRRLFESYHILGRHSGKELLKLIDNLKKGPELTPLEPSNSNDNVGKQEL